MSDNISQLIHEMILERVAPVVEVVADLQAKDTKVDVLSDALKEQMQKDTLSFVLKHLPKPAAVKIECKAWDGIKRDVDGAHPDIPLLVACLQQPSHHDRNLYVYGGAGSGKTTATIDLLELMGLKLHIQGAAMSKYDLLGFRLPDGTVVRTAFMDAWQHGGGIILDDTDRSDPKAMAALNAATANGTCDFSHCGLGLIPRHADCVILATGNTSMTGQDAKYSAASKQDAAFRDRFVFHKMEINEDFELQIMSEKFGEIGRQWTLRIQRIRAAAVSLGGNVDKVILASMRASNLGAALLTAGLSQKDTEEKVVFKGAGLDVSNVVYSKVGKPSTKKATVTNFGEDS